MALYPYFTDYGGGYCTEDDVKMLFPSGGNMTQLTDERIQVAITDCAIEMDSIFKRFYMTPISADPDALVLCRMLNKWLAAAYIHRHFYVSTNPNVSQGDKWRAQAFEYLNRIVPPRSGSAAAIGKSGAATDGTQPQPEIRFFLAPQQSPTELPDFPDGAAASENSDNDAQLNPDQGPYFRRNDRIPWQGGLT